LQLARRDHRGQRPRRRRRHQPRGHDVHVDAHGRRRDAAATGDLDIKDDLTLTGVSPASTIINAQGLGDRVIQTDPTGPDTITVTIQHLTVENGNSPQIASKNAEGGGIRNGRTAPPDPVPTAGTLHLIDVTVDQKAAAARGGGVANDGVMTIVDSVISNNTTNGNHGGGIIQDDEGSLSSAAPRSAITTPTPAAASAAASSSASSAPASTRRTIDASTISGNTAQGAAALGTAARSTSATTIGGNTSADERGRRRRISDADGYVAPMVP
jgi:hypothetical protein